MPLRYLAFALLLAAPAALGQAAEDLTLEAPDGTTVTIDRDTWGVPHVTAETEAAVFFGQGFAAAQDRLFQMETFWRTATGRLAELNPGGDQNNNGLPDNLEQDQAIRTVFYTPDERQQIFDALPTELQTMLSSYVAGVNAYIDSTAASPAVFLPGEYAAGGFQPEPWDVDKVVAVMQFFIRRFGEIGGEELERFQELQANGQEWFDENRPINDPTAPTTIHDGGDAPRSEIGAYRGAPISPAAAARAAEQRAALEASLEANEVPRKFGSFAAVVSQERSASGNVLLLGAPQMGQPSADAKAVTSEVELLVGEPESAALHVAGMTVPGIPGVIIGRTADRTWTFTTGNTDNTDTYIETTDEAFQQYFYDGAFQSFEVITETINVRGGDPVEYTHLRSVHGPVYFADAENNQAYTYKYAFWMRELEMAEALYSAWRADDLAGFQAAVAEFPVSFNIFYADKDQNIAYWHVGDYPVRPEGTDPRLPLAGDGSQEWEGHLPFEEHPQAVNPAQGYFVNWNNKPVSWWDQGDNIPWAEVGGRSYDGVSFLDAHLQESLAGGITFEELQRLACVVRSNPEYQEYPGTYQQVVEFSESGSYAENVIPPGQSGFVNASGVPSPHFADQWGLYESSVACEEVEMKPFTFLGEVAVSNAPDAALPDGFALDAAYPNPASGDAVTVRFDAPPGAPVRVELVDTLGRTVAVLADGRAGGPQTLTLDTGALAAGVYVLRLTTDGQTLTRKITVVR